MDKIFCGISVEAVKVWIINIVEKDKSVSQLTLVERPENQRCWVVRAEGGRYAQHFRQAGIIAIGHLDNLKIPEEKNNPFFPELEDIRAKILRSETNKEKVRSKHRAQIKTK